jgi:uncharacterized protein
MRTIALEEHITTPRYIAATEHLSHNSQNRHIQIFQEKLLDISDARIADMDAGGIDVQVLSLAAGALDKLDAATAALLARDANDLLAGAAARYAGRFAAFATLSLQEPEKAAEEFERCVRQHGFVGAMVHGTCDGLFLDDPRFTPLFAVAESLDVPIYLHPAPPPEAVQKAYFEGLPGAAGLMLSTAAWGWHVETGLHVLRLIASGLFDRFPKLKMIVGHMGENLPFSIARADAVLSRAGLDLKRSVREYFQEHFWLTTSGYFTLPPLQCAHDIMGIDRILFSVDYPFSPNAVGKKFLDTLPVNDVDREKIASGNAAKLLRL